VNQWQPVTAPTPRPSAEASLVLLVLTGGMVSQAAICRTAELAAGAPVTVMGTAGTEPERVRRAVAQAMSALEDTGVVALGHVAVTGSPGRAVARVARARGARVVVLDRGPAGPDPPGSPGGTGRPGDLAAELRRRMYGSGVVVVAPDDLGGTRGRR
jgi:hypothetical protein